MIKKTQGESSMKRADSQIATAAELPPRRSWFYKVAAGFLGAVVGVVPLAIGGLTFLDPWRRQPKAPKSRRSGAGENQGGQDGFIRIASLKALTIGAAPQRFPVIADQLDAWNFSPNQPVGAVYLQRVSETEVLCFNATCPHAGCSVLCDGAGFVCPCHNSSFELDGNRRPADSGRDNPSPRNLDSLEVDSKMLAQAEVWIKFQDFYIGKHEKIAKS